MSKDWADEQAARIAATVKRLRGKRSGQWLSDRTAELGHRVSRTTISELENGKRKYVSTAEICVLAWALKVPPVQLLYPNLPDGLVEVVPDVSVSSIHAATWFSGETVFYPDLDSQPGATEVDDEWKRRAADAVELARASRLMQIARDRITTETRIKTLSGLIPALRESEQAGLVDGFLDEIAGLQERKNAIDRELHGIEGAVVSDGG